MVGFSITGAAAMADELKIDLIREGKDDVAKHGQCVTVHYQGRLTDDMIFDASRPRGQPIHFNIGAGQVIHGWKQGFASVKVGEMRRLNSPADLGCDAAGAGGVIPPNAILVFDIELLTVSTPASSGQANPADLLHARKEGVVIVDI